MREGLIFFGLENRGDLFQFAAEGAVEAAGGLIEVVFGFIEDEVVSAGVVDGLAAEGFFEAGETVPGVGGVGVVGGDAPEVQGFHSLFFGVENGVDEEGDGGGEAAIFGVGGGLHVVANAVVVEEEGGGDDLVGSLFLGSLLVALFFS